MLLLLGCFNALAYNVAHSLVIKATSSVTTTVISEMKIVCVLVLSAVLLGEGSVWTARMMVGVTAAILGERTALACMHACCMADARCMGADFSAAPAHGRGSACRSAAGYSSA